MKFHTGYLNTYSSGDCNGICIWRRALWENLQCWAFYWGWGSYLFCLLILHLMIINLYFKYVAYVGSLLW